MSGGNGHFLGPDEVQEANLAMLQRLEKLILETGGKPDRYTVHLKCTNAQCGRESQVNRGDEGFDPTCRITLKGEPENGWRCDKLKGGCGGMLAVI